MWSLGRSDDAYSSVECILLHSVTVYVSLSIRSNNDNIQGGAVLQVILVKKA